jgi:CubicO group peptidase (beta-lactamase class C family)
MVWLAAEIRVKYAIPAMAIGVSKSDTCNYSVQEPTKENGHKEVVLKNKFHLGSNSKVISSFIAMKMVNEGKLQFHTKFIDMFPEMKDSIRKEYQLVSLGELLSHRAKVQP